MVVRLCQQERDNSLAALDGNGEGTNRYVRFYAQFISISSNVSDAERDVCPFLLFSMDV